MKFPVGTLIPRKAPAVYDSDAGSPSYRELRGKELTKNETNQKA
jgi:hypothetical protein